MNQGSLLKVSIFETLSYYCIRVDFTLMTSAFLLILHLMSFKEQNLMFTVSESRSH